MTLLPANHSPALPLRLVGPDDLSGLTAAEARLAEVNGFKAGPRDWLGLADAVLIGRPPALDIWSLAHLPMRLPPGDYRLESPVSAAEATAIATGWAIGCYEFTRYKAPSRAPARLVLPAGADADEATRIAAAVHLVRDLVNTPAEDLGPSELQAVARGMAESKGGSVRALNVAEYPLVEAVGRAGRPATFTEITWGDPSHPKVTIVGKGVCFDTGGLDIKPASGMLAMKKDMGGAAHALALAQLIMDAKLAIRLRVLIPAVDNAIAGNAFRPLDVIKSRRGLTVEIGNTDAEGRLILADALTEAENDPPALLIDFATLTGAARVALGPELPALFTPDDGLANELYASARAVNDPLWRLPLWHGYAAELDSKIADTNNVSTSPHNGAITAALFLAKFVAPERSWAHVDLFAWNASAKPGRPAGGEAMTLRAFYHLLQQRYSS